MNISKFSLATIVLTIIIAFCAIYFGIIPLNSSISTTKAEKESLAKEQEKTSQQLQFLHRMQQNENSINEYSTIAKKLIPETPDIEYLTLELEVFIKKIPLREANFEVSDLITASATQSGSAGNNTQNTSTPSNANSTASGQTPQAQTLLTGLKTHTFTISGIANYSDIITILNKIYTLDRLAEITQFNIGSKSSDTTSNSGNISMPGGNKNGLSIQIMGNFFSQTDSSASTKLADSFDPTILDKAAKYLKNRISYTTPIIIEKETGFGRSNPFAPY